MAISPTFAAHPDVAPVIVKPTILSPSRPSYPYRVGRAYDRLLNASLWNGDDAETISEHAARDQLAGLRIGCWVCWLLGLLIEKDHCLKIATAAYVAPPIVCARVGLAFAALLGGMAGIAELIKAILRHVF